MPDWIRRSALTDIVGVDFSKLRDEALYRNLDRLHPQRQAIEKVLAERERTLFNCDQAVFLYDLTSTSAAVKGDVAGDSGDLPNNESSPATK